MTEQQILEDRILQAAHKILEERFTRANYITSPHDVKEYLKIKLAQEEREIFGVLFLDTRHGILDNKILFKGTIDGAAVYPREVVKEALLQNAAAVVFYHNHPSSVTEPSEADKRITHRLRDALNLIDVRTLDHLIFGGVNKPFSFAEAGIL